MPPERRRAPPSPRRARGVSIVELMVGMVIALIVSSVAAAVYIGQQTSNRVAANMHRVQDDARFAADVIARDVRAAGDFACVPEITPVNTLVAPARFPLDRGVRGYEFDSAGVTIDAALPGSATVSGLNPASDVLAVSGLLSGVTALTAATVQGVGSMTVREPAPRFAAGDILLVSDCVNAAVFEASAVSTAGGVSTLTHAAGTGNTGVDLGRAFDPGTTVGRLEAVWYAVLAPAGRPRGLYRVLGTSGAPTLISERVRDMQITYDLDTDADGVADQTGRTAAQVGSDWSRVIAVRAALLVRSEDGGALDNAQVYTWNGAEVTATDRALYLPFDMNVRIRNR